MADKPNCYDCQHRRGVPGSAHSRCVHPSIGPGHPMAELIGLVGGPPLEFEAGQKLGIRAHERGVRSGWFAWPYNFDPVWLRECNGFEAALARLEKP